MTGVGGGRVQPASAGVAVVCEGAQGEADRCAALHLPDGGCSWMGATSAPGSLCIRAMARVWRIHPTLP